MIQDMLIRLNMGISHTMRSNKGTILGFIKIFLLINFILIIYSLLFKNVTWLLNSQIAFLGSLFIILASFFSYRKNIQNRLSNFDDLKQLEIDDSFDLYDENKKVEKEHLNSEKIKEIIEDEKQRVKKNSFGNIIFSISGFVSIYKFLGYGFLIFGFFALNNNKLFLVTPFLIGLFIIPLGTIISKLLLRFTQN